MRYMTYPSAQNVEHGCKVSWHTYTNQHDAEICAEAAKHNARIDEDLGYDFGFATPGDIQKTEDGRFRVTTP